MTNERQDLVLGWARNILGDPTFTHYLAIGDPACETIRAQIRELVRWATDAAAVNIDADWAVAEKWIGLSPAWLREKYQDTAARGSWTIPAHDNKLSDIDLTTGRPVRWADAPTIASRTEHEIDQYLFGW